MILTGSTPAVCMYIIDLIFSNVPYANCVIRYLITCVTHLWETVVKQRSSYV